jgi:hypothetical protein
VGQGLPNFSRSWLPAHEVVPYLRTLLANELVFLNIDCNVKVPSGAYTGIPTTMAEARRGF